MRGLATGAKYRGTVDLTAYATASVQTHAHTLPGFEPATSQLAVESNSGPLSSTGIRTRTDDWANWVWGICGRQLTGFWLTVVSLPGHIIGELLT